ncbi:MAG: ATP phosphoribosyltransferase regulatory subunit [Armatimonadota bacterium]|nr:ATP phosphoribosyltransferase regulatory subunit [Armatimonadota bacterium]MDR5697017.1 ATP phosphoribosyltransferase regulatory subunit [Armatimonadota bacterium]
MPSRTAPFRGHRIPDGLRDWLPDEWGRVRALEARLRALFGAWGYCEVATPVLECLDSVARGIGQTPQDWFVVVDRTGELLVLRPEMTVPMARLAAGHLTGRTVRLCYFAEVFRGRRARGAAREFRQAGVERIGDRGCEADGEVIALAAHALREAGVRDFRIGVGHVGLLRALLEAAGLDAGDRHTAQVLLYRRDFVTLRGLLAGSPARVRDVIFSLPELRGGDASAAVRDVGVGAEAVAEVDAVLATLPAFGVGDAVEMDLGLIRDFDYYTGVVFEGYTRGLGLPLLGGGRYDELLGRFGADRPAMGFAIELERVLPAADALAERRPALQIVYEPQARAAALDVARRARDAGWAVTVDPHPAEPLGGAPTLAFTTAGVRLSDPDGTQREVPGAHWQQIRGLLDGAR